ncbi:MAG: pyruvoyl-dependent arginine decarboxylase [Ilumatobacteraceae bacterium]
MFIPTRPVDRPLDTTRSVVSATLSAGHVGVETSLTLARCIPGPRSLADRTCSRPTSLTITIAAAAATARTGLAAFDRALVTVGAENRNLIRLSSVIPTGAVVVHSPARDRGEWGDRLYVVYAEQRANVPGEQAWAGVGWVQDQRTGAGLFVEHEGGGETQVRDLITASLEELQASRNIDFGPPQMVVTGVRCDNDPACALVLAAFGSQSWNDLTPADS